MLEKLRHVTIKGAEDRTRGAGQLLFGYLEPNAAGDFRVYADSISVNEWGDLFFHLDALGDVPKVIVSRGQWAEVWCIRPTEYHRAKEVADGTKEPLGQAD